MGIQIADSLQQTLQSNYVQAFMGMDANSDDGDYFNKHICTSWFPLLSLDSSAINPCFIALLFATIAGFFTITGAFELTNSLIYKKTYGKIGFNSNAIDSIVILLIFLNIATFITATVPLFINKDVPLYDIKVIGYGLSYFFMIFIATPLHLIEKSKVISQYFTLLFYWPLYSFSLSLLYLQGFLNEDTSLVPERGLIFVSIILSVCVSYIEIAQWHANDEIVEYFMSQGLDPHPPNLVSRLTFSWMNELIGKGYKKKGLENEDLPHPPLLVTANYSAPRLAHEWSKQMEKYKKDSSKKPKLLWALTMTFGWPVFVASIYDMLDSLISFIQPQLLRLLIVFFGRTDNPPLIIGFSIAVSMFFVSIIEAAMFNQNFIKTSEAGLGAKAGLLHLIYDKSIKLSPEAKLNRSTGDIVNHMSVDISRIQELTSYVQTLFSAPTRLILCLFSLYSLLGNATWAGIVTMIVMMPINTYLVKSLRKNHKTQMKLKDQRTQLVSDMLQNAKSIKLYAWEKPMLERLREVRDNKELKNLAKIGRLSAVVQFAWSCVPFFVSCSTFAIFAFTSKVPLTPEIVFPALSLFDLLSDPIFAIPALMTALIECGVSLNRLSSFLLAPEVDDKVIVRLPKVNSSNDVAVSIKNSTFIWVTPPNTDAKNYDEENEINQTKLALKDINFTAKKGQLSCIVGKVGSGKSTFLNSILGELTCLASDPTKSHGITLAGQVAYCSQVPWILNATVKENILFGAKFDEDFYNLTIRACELLPDLEILPDGDMTQVGEKGISLSGGQKARLSLARAVYARADIYLLDDILSAVDAHVGKSLTANVLSNTGLLGTKTRILATNSITVLKEANEIVLLQDQHIGESGDMKSVMAKKGALYGLIKEFGRQEEEQEQETEQVIGSSSSSSESVTSISREASSDVKSLTSSGTSEGTSEEESKLDEIDAEKNTALNGIKPFGLTMEDEAEAEIMKFGVPVQRSTSRGTLRRASMDSFKRRPILSDNGTKLRSAQGSEKKEKGKVKWSVYLKYAKACSVKGIVSVAVLMFLTVATSVAGNYWLKHWAEANKRTGSNSNVLKYVCVYASLGIGSGLITLCRAIILWSWCSIPGSKKLHSDMAQSVMGSPMSFFETTPLGRIINRFSQDMNKIDSAFPKVFSAVFGSILKTLFTLFIIGFNMPIVLVVIALLSVVYIYYQKYYIVTSRDLKRIVSISKSPIFSHVQESLNGAETIRAYGQHHRFLFQHSANIDYNQTSAYCMKSVNRWLSTRLQFIGSIIVLATSSCALASLNTSHPMTPGLIGLVMSYALRVTSSLSFIVKKSVEIESDLVCCERIFEYCSLPQEEKPELKNKITTASNWPSDGSVKFDHYTTKYRANLDPVLNNISLDVKPSEKVGIVGRTGAGKSTLALAIFRMIEPTSGHIEIDGVNTSEISLFNLRHNLNIIPQDSQAVAGTVKENLDPLGQYTDEELWRCLELAHLKEFVESLEQPSSNGENIDDQGGEAQPLLTNRDDNESSGLNAIIAESGSNLSAGQRQLMCLARALLNPSKVLVLDEATAAVDVQTDKIVQETIRTEFKDKTILTIAHRLDTIMDSDRIIVLDKGEVKEFDTPENLLNNKQSLFYGLCENGGYLSKSN